MADTLYLVDGMAFAFRSYYAIRANLTDSKGRPTNAVYGFVRVLLKLLREQDPKYIAVVFDAPGKTFRDEMYADYKATRKETPQDLLDQFPMMEEAVEALDIPKIVVSGVEADDVMGTLARRAEAVGMDTVLVTGDKDMLQLVNEHVKVFDPAKGDNGAWYSAAEVEERFGVGPNHVADALALIGDASDNVPGVQGIGEKTAKKLMAKYGSLEGLYEHLDDLKGKQQERVEQDRDKAFFSRELVTIKTDVDFEITPEACKRKELDRNKVIEAFNTLEFHSLIDDLFPEASEPGTEREYKLILDEATLEEAVGAMRSAGRFALDTETTSTVALQADLVGISMSCAADTGYYIPVGHRPEAMAAGDQPGDGPASAQPVEGLSKDRALELLRPLFEAPEVGKAGHNVKYDLLVLERAGIDVAGIEMDTMVASYLTDPSRLRHNLGEVSLQYLGRKLTPISSLIGKGSKAVTFDHVSVDRACAYACEDADVAWQLAEVFRSKLRASKLEALFHEVELPVLLVLARMERTGIAIDLEVFEGLRREISERLTTLEREIFDLAGEPFKVNSPKQLQGILFDKLGLKPVRKTKTGYSTDVDVLEELSRRHPLPQKILEYRGLEKLRGTYVEALPKLRHPETGRIHTSFNQAVAATGRLSSSEPNLQNIPVRTEMGRRIRAGFVPSAKDRRLISADYSQIELRILAHLSGDAALKQAFLQGADIHRDTAARVFGAAPDAVTPEMRRQAKAVNFGVVYGISAFGLARNLGIAQGEARAFIDAYFEQYPAVRQWLDTTLEEAKNEGYVETMLGRRRYLPELKSADANVRRGAERAAINTPVQGSAADIIKVAMVRLDEALAGQDAQMLLQVHDELVVEAPAEEAEGVAAAMKSVMGAAAALDVPVQVDVGIGVNWAEIH